MFQPKAIFAIFVLLNMSQKSVAGPVAGDTLLSVFFYKFEAPSDPCACTNSTEGCSTLFSLQSFQVMNVDNSSIQETGYTDGSIQSTVDTCYGGFSIGFDPILMRSNPVSVTDPELWTGAVQVIIELAETSNPSSTFRFEINATLDLDGNYTTRRSYQSMVDNGTQLDLSFRAQTIPELSPVTTETGTTPPLPISVDITTSNEQSTASNEPVTTMDNEITTAAAAAAFDTDTSVLIIVLAVTIAVLLILLILLIIALCCCVKHSCSATRTQKLKVKQAQTSESGLLDTIERSVKFESLESSEVDLEANRLFESTLSDQEEQATAEKPGKGKMNTYEPSLRIPRTDTVSVQKLIKQIEPDTASKPEKTAAEKPKVTDSKPPPVTTVSVHKLIKKIEPDAVGKKPEKLKASDSKSATASRAQSDASSASKLGKQLVRKSASIDTPESRRACSTSDVIPEKKPASKDTKSQLASNTSSDAVSKKQPLLPPASAKVPKKKQAGKSTEENPEKGSEVTAPGIFSRLQSSFHKKVRDKVAKIPPTAAQKLGLRPSRKESGTSLLKGDSRDIDDEDGYVDVLTPFGKAMQPTVEFSLTWQEEEPDDDTYTEDLKPKTSEESPDHGYDLVGFKVWDDVKKIKTQPAGESSKKTDENGYDLVNFKGGKAKTQQPAAVPGKQSSLEQKTDEDGYDLVDLKGQKSKTQSGPGEQSRPVQKTDEDGYDLVNFKGRKTKVLHGRGESLKEHDEDGYDLVDVDKKRKKNKVSPQTSQGKDDNIPLQRNPGYDTSTSQDKKDAVSYGYDLVNSRNKDGDRDMIPLQSNPGYAASSTTQDEKKQDPGYDLVNVKKKEDDMIPLQRNPGYAASTSQDGSSKKTEYDLVNANGTKNDNIPLQKNPGYAATSTTQAENTSPPQKNAPSATKARSTSKIPQSSVLSDTDKSSTVIGNPGADEPPKKKKADGKAQDGEYDYVVQFPRK